MPSVLGALVMAGIAAASGAAQPARGRLPLETFTSAQGLANDSIMAILPDSRGLLWFATLDGLSRYDGSRFVNYTPEQGIPDRMVWSLAEDRENAIWIGTAGGVARMTAAATRGPNLFARVPAVNGSDAAGAQLFVDRSGNTWSSCDSDLCVFRNGRFEPDLSFRAAGAGAPVQMAMSPSGEVWVATTNGLLRRALDGTWRRYAVQPARGADGIGGVTIDESGRVWTSSGYGFFVYSPSNDDHDPRPFVERAGVPLTPRDPLRLPRPGEVVMITTPSPSPIICRVPVRSRDGAIWQPCYAGLFRVADGRIDYFDGNDGLPHDVTTIAEDAVGDMWIGSRGSGVFRLVRSGATTWNRAHGLANQRIKSLFSLDDGSVCAVNLVGLSCFGKTELRHATLWTSEAPPGWGWNQIVARSRDGESWVASTRGLVRWPPVKRIEDIGRAARAAIYTMRDGLDWDEVFRAWMDSRGAVWVGTFGKNPLSRLEPRANRFVSYGPERGVSGTPTAFAEDRAGNVWIGLYSGGLLRVSGDHFETITRDVPPGLVRALVVDSKGGLWVGTTAALVRIEDPTASAEKLSFRRYTREDGLASNSGYCIVEMPDHRIAIGSQRGLDVLDRTSGEVVHVSMREGLASDEVTVAMVDRDGALWLGTINGLSRLARIPTPRFTPPPRLRIDEVLVDGVPTPVAELGAISIEGLRIEYPKHSMLVRFTAPDHDPARPLRFEYRFAEGGPWTDAGTQRSVMFDRLSGGANTLEIRAVAPSGRRSEPARLAFVYVPAVWKRPWFLALVAAVALLLAFLAHRYRMAQAVALERVRTRAATDLHDDLGSSLSRISILSEVAKRRLGETGSEPILDEIADSARGLVDALGDSIWSIDPQLDDVRSLLLRVRQFAAAVFETQSIAIDIRVDPETARLPLRPEQRRETYLILKEALNNAAKHSGARQVAVHVSVEGRTLRIAIEDDGKGITIPLGEREDGGRGVPSMVARARRAGGRLEIDSRPGLGTSVTVAMPL